jgi:hypothetical protein
MGLMDNVDPSKINEQRDKTDLDEKALEKLKNQHKSEGQED